MSQHLVLSDQLVAISVNLIIKDIKVAPEDVIQLHAMPDLNKV